MATGAFSPGEYAVGKTSGKPVMNFGHPVKDSAGKTVGCIAMGLNLEYFRQHFEKAAVPAQASFVFLDHRGVVLYRYLDPGKYVGTTFPDHEMRAMRTGPAEYTDVGAGLDGVRRIRASVSLSLRDGEAPYLFILAGIPYDTLVIAARNKLISRIFFLRTIFYHQRDWGGHRTRACHHLWHRQAEQRPY